MRFALKKLVLSWVIMATLSGTGCSAGKSMELDNTQDIALRLITAMRVGEESVLGFQASLAAYRSEGRSPAEEAVASCIRALPFNSYDDILVEKVRTEMSEEEIIQALQFYESAAGRNATRASISRARLEMGVPGALPADELSAEDRDAIAAFERTDAGKRLITDKILLEKAVVQQVSERNSALLQGCIQQAK